MLYTILVCLIFLWEMILSALTTINSLSRKHQRVTLSQSLKEVALAPVLLLLFLTARSTYEQTGAIRSVLILLSFSCGYVVIMASKLIVTSGNRQQQVVVFLFDLLPCLALFLMGVLHHQGAAAVIRMASLLSYAFIRGLRMWLSVRSRQ
ncbi:MAG: hypothetical protein IJM26_08550 [Lachnospiraceae bacterium]|nr:hypothetical protein [Lachnospiraceae bacterium]